MTETALTTKARPPRAVIEIMDPKQGVKQIHINGDAIPGRGEDDLLTLLAMQVLDATKINTHTDADKAQRYNAAIAALHDIAPVGALEGMLATQLIATHMAMDCYKHINATNDRNTHAYHLNQVNKLSRTYVVAGGPQSSPWQGPAEGHGRARACASRWPSYCWAR